MTPDHSLIRYTGWAYWPIAFIARLPFAMMTVGVLMLVVAVTGSVRLGGLTSAAVGVVAVATVSDFLSPSVSWIPKIPIHYCAMVGALALLWLKVLSPREAYASIDWQVLLMLYGLLGLGMFGLAAFRRRRS